MKFLYYEDPMGHGFPSESNQLASLHEPLLKILGHELVSTTTLNEVVESISGEEFDFVLIHHQSFREVDYLKKNYPDLKIGAYSGNLFLNPLKNSIGEEFKEKLGQRYDFLMPFDESLMEFVDKLEKCIM
jgi:hypothetical protein